MNTEVDTKIDRDAIKDTSYLIIAITGAVAGIAYAIKAVIEVKEKLDEIREKNKPQENIIIEP